MHRPHTLPRTLAVAAAATLVGLLLPAVGHAADEDVDVVDNDFDPSSVSVTVGDTVTWTHTGSFPHTVTADDGSLDSHPDCSGGTDCMQNGDTYDMVFDEPGEYPYYCKIHGAAGGVGMSGVITVAADGTATPTPTETTSPTPTETEAPVTGSLDVSDQTGDGTSVVVDTATISGSDGFVVVHADSDGAPGPVLGQAPIDEGTTTDLSVPIDTPLTEDQTVWPMLHVDAGEAGTYEFPGADGPVTVDDQVVVLPLAYTVAAADAADTDDSTAAADELATTGIDDPWWLLVVGLALLAAGSGTVALARPRA